MLVGITGASGFVGSYTVRALKERGHRVRALVRRTSRRDHIAAMVDEWIVGEMDEAQAMSGLAAGVECIIHAAVDFAAAESMPSASFRRNVLGSLELLEASRKAGVEQFLFVSSGAAYAEILQDRKLDEKHPTWPDSLYGAYKAAVEPFLKAYHKQFGLNTSSWRPVAVYGVDPEVVKSRWLNLVRAVQRGERVSEAAGGKIVHVQDVADALACAVGDASVAGEFYNLVDRHMYWQVAAEIAMELTGSASVIEERKGPGPKNTYDCAKAMAFLDRYGKTKALRRGLDGVRDYVGELLQSGVTAKAPHTT
jgi:nucleoside-diphosphate-sugar epimerase